MNVRNLVFPLCLLLLSCQPEMPDWVLNAEHAVSPDGRAALYVSRLEEGKMAVGTWVLTEMGAGGAGIFDLETTAPAKINVSWLSDQTALIEYPVNAKITRQEDSSFFAGRTIYFQYKSQPD